LFAAPAAKRSSRQTGQSGEVSKLFFFEKKNQKTFTGLGRASPERPKPNRQKFFASFFQKRRPVLSRQPRLQ
jgi:hypothetical protein